MQKLIKSIRVFIFLAILLGLIYPFFILMVSNIFFPYQANGSLLEYQGKIIGSALIAQEFSSPKYFYGRFSFIGYNALVSGGSNFGSYNKNLIIQTKERIGLIRFENNFSQDIKLPADMMLSSASGLDPHISLYNAKLQVDRVAKHRQLSEEAIVNLIYSNIDHSVVGVWVVDSVNVLKLNIALDKLEKHMGKKG